MRKNTELPKRRPRATLTAEETTQIIISLESKLRLLRRDVDRLSMTRRINSIARRVAELEARREGN